MQNRDQRKRNFVIIIAKSITCHANVRRKHNNNDAFSTRIQTFCLNFINGNDKLVNVLVFIVYLHKNSCLSLGSNLLGRRQIVVH